MLYRPLKGAISSLKRCYINSTTLYFQGFAGGLKLLKLIKTNKKAKSQKNLWITQFFAMRFCLFFCFSFTEKTKEIRTTFVFCSIKVHKGSETSILLSLLSRLCDPLKNIKKQKNAPLRFALFLVLFLSLNHGFCGIIVYSFCFR